MPVKRYLSLRSPMFKCIAEEKQHRTGYLRRKIADNFPARFVAVGQAVIKRTLSIPFNHYVTIIGVEFNVLPELFNSHHINNIYRHSLKGRGNPPPPSAPGFVKGPFDKRRRAVIRQRQAVFAAHLDSGIHAIPYLRRHIKAADGEGTLCLCAGRNDRQPPAPT